MRKSINKSTDKSYDIISRRHFMIGTLGLGSCAVAHLAFGQEAASLPVANTPTANPLVLSARKQIGVTLYYDGAYVKIPYPNGDIDRARGVCTDVIIRAYRDAYGYDLQRTVHEDMEKFFKAYPKQWGLNAPDSNIDHRRVPNLQMFFKQHHAELPKKTKLKDLKPGDLVTMMLPRNLPHIAIISDKKNDEGIPYIIHNVGRGTQEEDFIERFPVTGFYRFVPSQRK